MVNVTVGLLVRLEAQHGKDAELEAFLRSALPLVQQEPGTKAWFAVKFGRSDYGIFDVFPGEAERDAHLTGEVAKALFARAGELLSEAPKVEKIRIIASKFPTGAHEPIVNGLLLTLKATSGREAEVEQILAGARSLVEAEPKTLVWFAVQFDAETFGIFDVFPDQAGRFAHLTGHVPRELAKHALSIVGGVPDLDLLNVLADDVRTA
jgi:quinol monooxygenase YgiN